ncbi:MAG: hypothetical protein E5W40_19150, partial [Mesorhizobium sp.]
MDSDFRADAVATDSRPTSGGGWRYEVLIIICAVLQSAGLEASLKLFVGIGGAVATAFLLV